jgi:colanic acid/amylovoran biosynthesis glycosyltransferase
MRIAFFVGAFPTISETFILDQIAGLIERGHQVSVFGRAPEDPTVLQTSAACAAVKHRTYYFPTGVGAPLRTTARTLGLLLREPKATLRCMGRLRLAPSPVAIAAAAHLWTRAATMLWAGELSFDVIVAHFGPHAVLAHDLRQLHVLRGPLVSVFHGRDVSFVLRQHGPGYYRDLFERGELMLPVSTYFEDRLVRHGCAAARIRVQRMGVDTRRYQYQPRSLSPGQTVRLISVCRLVPKKGIDFALQALARLPESAPEFEWRILGDGPERAKLMRRCDQLGLSKRVTFEGAVARDRVLNALQASHIFLAPSVTASDGDEEGVPVSIMEAAACGLPVVSTLHSGIPELVRDGATGYLVPEWDVDALAIKLATLMAADGCWPEFGRAGRRIVEAHYNLDALNDQLTVILQSVASAFAKRAA